MSLMHERSGVLQSFACVVPYGFDMWSMIYGCLGINWAMMGSVKGEILAWRGYIKMERL